MSHSLRTISDQISNRLRVRLGGFGPSKTQQAHASSCDINNIYERYARTGILPPASLRSQPQFADVTALQGDLTERHEFAQATIAKANQFISSQQNKQQSPPSPPSPPAPPSPPSPPSPPASS